MLEFSRRWTFSNKSSNGAVLDEPSRNQGMFLESGRVEGQVHLPYSLTGDTNVSVVEPSDANEKIYHQSGLRRYMFFNIDRSWTDLILILCGFVSGLVDGLSFTFWNSFSDMQTGNIIWAALGLAGKPDHPGKLWAKALISVAAFLVGTFCFIYGSRLLGPLRRLTMILSFALQTVLLLIAALLAQTHAINETPNQDPTQWLQNVAIALLAFQSAGQILASKFLGFPEIPTVALTALMCDLFLDKKLFQRPWSSNPKRNRKLGFIVALLFGAMTAGGMAKDHGLASGLWLAVALKGAITLSWFVWPECPSSEEGEKCNGD